MPATMTGHRKGLTWHALPVDVTAAKGGNRLREWG